MSTANIFITDSDYSCDDKNFKYIIWFQPSVWAMVLNKDKLDIILDSRYSWNFWIIERRSECIRNIIWNNDLKINCIKKSWSTVDEIIKSTYESKKLIVEWKIAYEYVKELKDKSWKQIELLKWGYFNKQRLKKDEQEKYKIEKAITIIDYIYIEIEKIVNSGEIIWKSEIEVKKIIKNKIIELSWEWESFSPIVAFWKNSAIPHHNPSNKMIEKWPLLIDMWALYSWYCSDFTRTIWVWEKSWEEYEEFKKVYDIVKNAHEKAFKETKKWMTGIEVDKIARDFIEENGYWEYFTHSLWHWVWIEIHEAPWITNKKAWENKIDNHQVFTIEPWIYIPWKFWIRLEDIVYMRNWKLKKYTKVEL